MNIFYPDIDYENVYDIPFEKLHYAGIRGVIFDVDNTLVRHGYPADEKIKSLFDKLRSLDIKTCLVSNNKNNRVESFAKEVNSIYIADAKKPFKKNYLKAIELMNVDKEKVVFVGDQIFTDIWGAKRCKIYSILVKPIHIKEEIQIVIKRFFENIVLHFYRKKKYANKNR